MAVYVEDHGRIISQSRMNRAQASMVVGRLFGVWQLKEQRTNLQTLEHQLQLKVWNRLNVIRKDIRILATEKVPNANNYKIARLTRIGSAQFITQAVDVRDAASRSLCELAGTSTDDHHLLVEAGGIQTIMSLLDNPDIAAFQKDKHLERECALTESSRYNISVIMLSCALTESSRYNILIIMCPDGEFSL